MISVKSDSYSNSTIREWALLSKMLYMLQVDFRDSRSTRNTGLSIPFGEIEKRFSIREYSPDTGIRKRSYSFLSCLESVLITVDGRALSVTMFWGATSVAVVQDECCSGIERFQTAT